jgi:hypothetical protein
MLCIENILPAKHKFSVNATFIFFMDKLEQYFKYFKNKYFIVIHLITQCGVECMLNDKIAFWKIDGSNKIFRLSDFHPFMCETSWLRVIEDDL